MDDGNETVELPGTESWPGQDAGSFRQASTTAEAATRGRRPPEIILAQELPPAFCQYLSRSFEALGRAVEIGGMLVGHYTKAEGASVFSIQGLIEAGPNADCTPESVLFDTDYQSGQLSHLRLEHPTAGNMGCIHVHPEQMDVCSQGDWLADLDAVGASDTKALVFAVVTLDNPRPDPLSLFYENLKFDFFVLGHETGFEYFHVRPTLRNLPLLRAPTATAPARVNEAPKPRHRHWAWRPKLLNDRRRLVAEVRAVEEHYGGRATLRLDGNCLYWEYTVVESGRRFPIQVRYPRRYPLEPPRIVSVLPLPCSPHQMQDNELCWTNRLGKCDWNPSRDTAATCITAAHRWFACLLVYLTLGKWPEEADEEPLYPV